MLQCNSKLGSSPIYGSLYNTNIHSLCISLQNQIKLFWWLSLVSFITTCDLTRGTFMRISSDDCWLFWSWVELAAPPGPLTSQRPALCCGRKQWTKWIRVRRSCSHKPSMWNLVWRATEWRLIPAVPLEIQKRILVPLIQAFFGPFEKNQGQRNSSL